MRRRQLGLSGLVCLVLLAACAVAPAGMLRPNGVAVSRDGSLYVMDRGNYRVAHLAPDGKLLDAFGQLGTGMQDLYYGWDIALDQAGNIYVCNHVYDDAGSFVIHDGVKVFTSQGQLAREIGAQEYEYNDNTNRPYGIDVDEQGRVYIANYNANTLAVFNAQGDPLGEFFGEQGNLAGQFYGLNDVAVDDQRQLVYITDQLNSRVQRFALTVTASGAVSLTFQSSFGSYGRQPGAFAYLQNLVVDDKSGYLYVGDMANHRIQVFTSEGQYVSELIPPAKVWQVMGLGIDATGAVYAADARNDAIWVFAPDGNVRKIEVRP
jgi:DNA-binding beta-propeller fold protein YncE